jgi:hypothetical protein
MMLIRAENDRKTQQITLVAAFFGERGAMVNG